MPASYNSPPLAELLGRLQESGFDGPFEPLHGGLINCVWRVRGQSGSASPTAVLKWAPDHVAAVPELPLGAERVLFEARALAAFEDPASLGGIAGAACRPPLLLGVFEDLRAILIEDLGPLPDLAASLREPGFDEAAAALAGRSLGAFIGRLHSQTFGRAALAVQFDNRGVQKSRLDLHYARVGSYAERAGLPDAAELGRRAVAYGELLQLAGVCLVMGDLWPFSTLVSGTDLRVIDWEFASFGRPSQDIGHFAAHLWMQAHRAPDGASRAKADALLESFLRAYGCALGERRGDVFGEAARQESATHFGAEILARTVGAFQSGYLYAGLEPVDPLIRQAVTVAAVHIRTPTAVDTFRLV